MISRRASQRCCEAPVASWLQYWGTDGLFTTSFTAAYVQIARGKQRALTLSFSLKVWNVLHDSEIWTHEIFLIFLAFLFSYFSSYLVTFMSKEKMIPLLITSLLVIFSRFIVRLYILLNRVHLLFCTYLHGSDLSTEVYLLNALLANILLV